MNNLGIDARIWHIFEQSNFNVKNLCDEIVRIAEIHIKIDRGNLLEELESAFSIIKFRVVVIGADEQNGLRNVTNLSSDAAYTIDFYTKKPINCTPLILSAIFSRGFFENDFNTYAILFVKAIAKINGNEHVVRLVKMDRYLTPKSRFFALQMVPNTISFRTNTDDSSYGPHLYEKSMNWWSKQDFDIRSDKIRITKKTREGMGRVSRCQKILSKAGREGFSNVSIMLNFNPSESDFSKRRQIKLKRGRTEVWMGGNENLSFYDLVHKYHNAVDQLSSDFYINYLEESIIIGKKSVKSCISISNRLGHNRNVEFRRLIRVMDCI